MPAPHLHTSLRPHLPALPTAQGLDPQVHAFLAQHASLEVVWEKCELPRSGAGAGRAASDCTSVFSVLSGSMTAV
eukprot:334574-Chlamydomonas_euryale.AAC.1